MTITPMLWDGGSFHLRSSIPNTAPTTAPTNAAFARSDPGVPSVPKNTPPRKLSAESVGKLCLAAPGGWKLAATGFEASSNQTSLVLSEQWELVCGRHLEGAKTRCTRPRVGRRWPSPVRQLRTTLASTVHRRAPLRKRNLEG